MYNILILFFLRARTRSRWISFRLNKITRARIKILSSDSLIFYNFFLYSFSFRVFGVIRWVQRLRCSLISIFGLNCDSAILFTLEITLLLRVNFRVTIFFLYLWVSTRVKDFTIWLICLLRGYFPFNITFFIYIKVLCVNFFLCNLESIYLVLLNLVIL